MITIIYDTVSELENLRDFFDHKHGCVDFSDALDPDETGACCSGSCKECRAHFFRHNVVTRSDYAAADPYISRETRSCNTCDNAPICWLSSTAAAPAPCAYYVRRFKK